MASSNTIYVKYLRSPLDQTTGFQVQGSNIIGPLGMMNVVTNSIGTVDPMAWMGTNFFPQDHETGWAEFDAGQHHPRFYKGGFQPSYDHVMRPLDTRLAQMAEEKVDILDASLSRISQIVTPSVANKSTYGTEIGNVLKQACSDVEGQLKGILKANGYVRQGGGHWNRVDYAKVSIPMRLEEYSVRLQRYEDYPPIFPFKGWMPGPAPKFIPTPLPWYDAYNAIKHDPELDFDHAMLEHGIAAVAGLHVLLLAQWGTTEQRQRHRNAYFVLDKTPYWEHKDRTYAPPPGGQWTPVPYQF